MNAGKSPNKILVVEDESIVALDIERGLKRIGYGIAGIVDNGRDAIRLAGETRPDLVLMDIQIKGDMDGIDTAQEIHRRFNIPVIFLTAYSDEATLQRAKLTEPFGYLLKPFEETELRTAIEVVLHKHKSVETQQERAVTALKLSEETFRIFVESVQDYGIFMMDPLGVIMSWNIGSQRIKGFGAGEVIGKHFSIFYTKEDIAIRKPEKELVIAEKEGRYEEESWRVRKDGTTFWARVTITALRDKHGALLAFGKVTRDLTLKKKAEDQLRESEERKSAVLEAALDCVVTMDDLGKILDFNRAAEETFGWKREQVIDKEMASVIVPEKFRESHRKGLRNYLATGVGPVLRQRIELSALRADGSEFPVELSILDLQVNGKKLFTGFLRDISTQKRAEEILKNAIKARDEFLTIASHELKTPLTALKLQLQLSQMHLSKLEIEPGKQKLQPEKLERFLSLSVRQVDSLTGLVEELLDVGMIQTGRLSLYIGETRLSDLVREVVDRFSPKLIMLRCSLETELEDGIVGYWDAHRIEQVLVNLIENIVKYAPGAKIRISTKREKNKIILIVEDNGPGIPEDRQGQIFERFERATPLKHVSGLGLGLFVVKRIVESHQGTVQLQSALGQGSKFTICLPEKVT